MAWSGIGQGGSGGLLVGAAAVITFLASRAGAGALAGDDPELPGWRAVGHWCPIAITAIVAMFYRLPGVAVALVFATSVASLSLIMGLVCSITPPDLEVPWKRLWRFVLPAAMLPLVAGFSGRLTLVHALLFALLGGSLLSLWLDRPQSLQQVLRHASESDEDRQAARARRRLQWGIALALGIVGAFALCYGVQATARGGRALPMDTIAVVLVSPILTLPMLASGSPLAQRGQTASVATTLVGVVLLNLCALLPILIVCHYGHEIVPRLLRKESIDAIDPSLTYGLLAWRLDTMMLVVFGLAMIPVSLGRWAVGWVEAAALIVVYAAYLFVNTVMARRI